MIYALVILIAYPVIAGLVFKKIREGRPCNGENPVFGTAFHACEGPYGTSRCLDCVRHRTALTIAWLWPISWLLVLSLKLFNIGANKSLTTSTEYSTQGCISNSVEVVRDLVAMC